MKILIYFLVFVLISMAFFVFAYTTTSNFISLKGVIKAATISRFIEPKEIKTLVNTMERLPVGRNGSAILDEYGQSLFYYDLETGQISRIDVDSQVQTILLQKLPTYLKDLQWSSDRTKILTSNGSQNLYFDLSSSKSQALSNDIISPIFSPSGKELAYIQYTSTKNGAYLALSDIDFKATKKLLPLSAGEWEMFWPNENTLSLSYSDKTKDHLFLFDIKTGSLTRILTNLRSLEVKWSEDGQALFYSHLNQEDRIELVYKILSTNKEYMLPLSTTASKCVSETKQQIVYCAVPIDDSRPEKEDKFVAVNLFDSSVYSLKGAGVNKIKAENLFLSADNTHLFFKNSYNSNLYRLRIELN